MPNEEVFKQYDEVRLSLENAIKVADNIEVYGEEENAELTYIRNTLAQLNADFKTEIEKLENSSEWDKFCMAFFGETNAGKSTIIEALRIIYNEESRRAELAEQEAQFEYQLADEKTKYSELVSIINQMNVALDSQNNMKIKKALKVIGFVAIGVVIGFFAAFCLL
ncbi:MAG: hypothetical protein MJ119_05225 [Lachnospiraceae bacterium]|nr:hypothetical protein [Lachnospiraceae bacterium]